MKRVLITLIAIAAFAVTSVASANTGQLQVNCNGLTFTYQNFSSNTTVGYTVSTAKKSISGSFQISGAGSVFVAVNLSGSVTATLSWPGHSVSASGILGCGGSGGGSISQGPIYDYCGTTGPVVFAELLFGQPLWDPVWHGYTPAAYVEGLGSMCPWDVPAGYKDAGVKVDPVGQNYGGNEEGAIYELYVKA